MDSRSADSGTPCAGSKYANYFEIGHNELEFVLEFGERFSEGEAARVHTRIVTNPTYARLLCRTIEEALREYDRERQSLGDDGKPGSEDDGEL